MCSVSEFYKSQLPYERLCALPKGDIKTDLMVKPDGEREAGRKRKIDRREKNRMRNERLTVLYSEFGKDFVYTLNKFSLKKSVVLLCHYVVLPVYGLGFLLVQGSCITKRKKIEGSEYFLNALYCTLAYNSSWCYCCHWDNTRLHSTHMNKNNKCTWSLYK